MSTPPIQPSAHCRRSQTQEGIELTKLFQTHAGHHPIHEVV